MALDVYWGGQGDEYPKIADEVARGVFKELDYHNEVLRVSLYHDSQYENHAKHC